MNFFIGNDIHETINLGFQESLQDKIRKTIQVEKTVKCKTCRGTRCAPNTFPSKCYTCGGSGTLQYRDKFDTVEEICDNCEGFGKIIRHKCSTCKGEGQVTRTVNQPFLNFFCFTKLIFRQKRKLKSQKEQKMGRY